MGTQDLTGGAGARDMKVTAAVKPGTEPPLPAAYWLTLEQAAFFKAETGIDDDSELRSHIPRVQEKAYEVSYVMSRVHLNDE